MAPPSSRKSGEGRSDSLYRAVVDTAVDAIVVIDRNGAIRSVNQAAQRMFGYARLDILGRNVELLLPPADEDQKWTLVHERAQLRGYRPEGPDTQAGSGTGRQHLRLCPW